MAEFCNKCAKKLGFPYPDINVPEMFDDLQNETCFPVLCEGCGMLAIGKDTDGELIMMFDVVEQKENKDNIHEETTGWLRKDINEYKK